MVDEYIPAFGMWRIIFLAVLMRSAFSVKPYIMQTITLDKADVSSSSQVLVKGYSGYIHSHDSKKTFTYQSDKRFFLTIEAPEGYQILLETVDFYLGYPEGSQKCLSDSLFLFNKQPDGELLPSEMSYTLGEMIGEYCTVKNQSVLAVSAKNSIFLFFHSGPIEKRYSSSKGFVLKWTVFRPLRDNQNCLNQSEFMCATRRTCIPLTIACDSVAHCSDSSDLDESRQASAGCEGIKHVDTASSAISGSALIGIIFGVILPFVITIAIIICCCSPRKKEDGSASSRSHFSVGTDYKASHDIYDCRQKLNVNPAIDELQFNKCSTSDRCKHSANDKLFHHDNGFV